MRLPGCATASAIRSPSSPRALPSANSAQLGMAPGEPGTGEHGGQDRPDRSARGAAPHRGTPRSARGSRSPDDSRPGAGRRRRGSGSPAPAGRPPRWPWRARGRAGRRRWPGHTRPRCRNGVTERPRPVPADAGRRGPRRGPRPRADTPGSAQSRQTAGAPSAGRAGGRWPARVCRASPADAARALSACSKYPTASR